MKIGISVRSEFDYYFVKKRYLKYFNEFDVCFIYPYINIARACVDIDGFVIVGGADFNPNKYGEENYSSHGIDDEIDDLDLEIISYATTNKKPIFGICRGLQAINIYFNGTLKQHIVNHENANHKIILVENFLDFPDTENVNSYHHQSVKKLGDDLCVLYYSSCGEVECLIHKTYPIIAVQFHPEMDLNNSFYMFLKEYFKSLINLYK